MWGIGQIQEAMPFVETPRLFVFGVDDHRDGGNLRRVAICAIQGVGEKRPAESGKCKVTSKSADQHGWHGGIARQLATQGIWQTRQMDGRRR